MAVIAFVPARGGSKSIPLKNIKSFCGKPLIFWVLKGLQESNRVDSIVLATDSFEIEKVALSFSFNKIIVYKRKQENAMDNSSTESVILEYLKHPASIAKQNDIFLLVQATSPFTLVSDFDNAIDLFVNNNYNSILSCSVFKRFIWNNNKALNYDIKLRPRRQDFEGVHLENGAIYISTVNNILASECRISEPICIYQMPEYTMQELDEPLDWLIGEKVMQEFVLKKQQKSKIKLFVSDVDGVLTDSGMYYSEKGDELKKFNTRDGKAFELLKSEGIKTAIVTSEKTNIVRMRGLKLKIDYITQGVSGIEKLEAIKNICDSENIQLTEVSYIGDDINCINALLSVGFPACPNDAEEEIKQLPNILVLSRNGGSGVVREFTNYVIKKNNCIYK